MRIEHVRPQGLEIRIRRFGAGIPAGEQQIRLIIISLRDKEIK
jgi:hypothetical protein